MVEVVSVLQLKDPQDLSNKLKSNDLKEIWRKVAATVSDTNDKGADQAHVDLSSKGILPAIDVLSGNAIIGVLIELGYGMILVAVTLHLGRYLVEMEVLGDFQ
ncbi:Secretory carrier-associated membrane protein 3 [Bienertia sinuspersici]